MKRLEDTPSAAESKTNSPCVRIVQCSAPSATTAAHDDLGGHLGAHAAEGEEGQDLGQQEAVSVHDGVAALPQRRLSAEVCDDVHQAIPQALHRHAVRDALQQPQGVHIPSNIVHQLTCSHRHPHWLPSQYALHGRLLGLNFDAAQQDGKLMCI
jgi:hypothetical protein